MARYYREDNGDIYDRKTGETIQVLEEENRRNNYAVRDYRGWHEIDKDDIEEKH